VLAGMLPEERRLLNTFARLQPRCHRGKREQLVEHPRRGREIGPGLDYKYGGKYPYAGYCRFDTTRAQQELGFTPDYDLEDAMRDYAAELRRLNLLQ